jgi:hypothetical protein
VRDLSSHFEFRVALDLDKVMIVVPKFAFVPPNNQRSKLNDVEAFRQ